MPQRTVFKLAQFGSFLYLVNNYIFEVTMCVGPSMLPTFSSAGDIVLVEHISKVEKGNIVISISPNNPTQTVCKRVVGMSGDIIKLNNKNSYKQEGKNITIPKGRVWLEGDNPANSTDSRNYGAVPMCMLRGKVFFRLWPLTQFGRIEK